MSGWLQMSIIKSFNDYLEKEQSKRATRVGSGKIKPSGLGQCYRRQFYSIRQEPETNPSDLPSVKRMLLGTVAHETIQKAFVNTEVLTEDNAVKGYADIVGEDYVCDIKTVNPYAFKWLLGKNFDLHKDKADHCLQVATYCLMLNKPYGKLLYVNCGDFNKMEEFTFDADMYKDKLNKELKVIGNYLQEDRLPKPEPRLYDGKECSYCNWKDKCGYLTKE